MVIANVCERYACLPYAAHLALGMDPLSRRGQARLLVGVMQVTGLQEAHAEFHRKGGAPSAGQVALLAEVERLYCDREGFEMVVEEGEDVQTPTDIAAQLEAELAGADGGD